MSAGWKHIFLVFIISGVTGLRVHVRVDEDDNGESGEYDQDYRLINNLDPEDPPFQVPEVPPVPKVTHHTVSVEDHIRAKRDDDELGEWKPYPLQYCYEWEEKAFAHNDHKFLQVSRVIAINDTIVFPFHHCGSVDFYFKPRGEFGRIRWRYLNRTSTFGNWTLSTVLGPGASRRDDDFESRVNITSNMSLIIRNVQEKDTGMYYPARFYPNKFLYNFTEKGIRNFFSREAKRSRTFTVYFHLDVSFTDSAYPLPAPNVRNSDVNLEFSTAWEEWSPCSVCGEEGEHWRKGLCWANILDRTKVIYPPHVYYVLMGSEKGIRCRSSLFHQYPKLTQPTRADEIIYEPCNVTCVNGTLTNRMTSMLEKLKFESLADADHTKITVMEGDSAILKCPWVSLDTVVYWVNGSKYLTSLRLRNITNNRAEIDVYGVLRFHSTVVADSGFYSCWHTKKRQIIYALTVIPYDNSGEWYYQIRFVGLSFIFDAVIFLALLAVKHKHRHVRQPRRPRKVEDDDECDDEAFNENCNNMYSDSSEEEWDDYNEGHFG